MIREHKRRSFSQKNVDITFDFQAALACDQYRTGFELLVRNTVMGMKMDAINYS
jgi:hypothetical protein